MKIPSVQHSVQREILRRLAQAEALRFSELKPDGMESNIFMYHLHQLMQNSCVEKADGSYRLGLNGLRYAHNVNNGNFVPDREPKVIAVIVLINGSGEVLLVRRGKQPYINRYMFISGRQQFGENPDAHAQRELQEKAGLGNLLLQRRGMIDCRVRTPAEEVLTHIVGYVYSGIYDGQAPPTIGYWGFSWHNPRDLQDNKLPLLPGTAELYVAIQDHADTTFFASYDTVY